MGIINKSSLKVILGCLEGVVIKIIIGLINIFSITWLREGVKEQDLGLGLGLCLGLAKFFLVTTIKKFNGLYCFLEASEKN